MVAAVQVIGSPAVDRAAERGAAVLAGRDLWSDVPSETARTLLCAGVEAFSTWGFHGTNLRKITDGTGLSTAALYVHFGSKEDLLFEISKRGYQETVGIVDAATRSADPAESLLVMIYAMTRWQAENHTTARVVYYESSALTKAHAAELLELRRHGEHRVREVIEAGVAEGAFVGGEVRGIGAALLSLGVDVARWYGPLSPYDPDQLGRLYCVLASRLVGFIDES